MSSTQTHPHTPSSGGSNKNLGLYKKNKAFAHPSRRTIAAELAAQGHPFQAKLLKGCGKSFTDTDATTGQPVIRQNRCKYGKLCDRCSYIAGMQARRKIRAREEIIGQADQLAIEQATDTLTSVQQQITAFVQQWADTKPRPGRSTRQRKQLRADWLVLARRVRALRDRLPTAPAEEWIRSAKQAMKEDQQIDIAQIITIAQAVGQHLYHALADRQDYTLQHITLSLQTAPADRPNTHRLRQHVARLKAHIKHLLTAGALAGPGTGAIVSIHPQEHIHAHLLYYGPVPTEKTLKDAWAAITHGSYHVQIDEIFTDEHRDRIIHYLYNLPSPDKVPVAERVRFWQATQGMRHVSYYGVFHHKTQRVLQQRIEAAAQAVDAATLLRTMNVDPMALAFNVQQARLWHHTLDKSLQYQAQHGYRHTKEDKRLLSLLEDLAHPRNSIDAARALYALLYPSSHSEVSHVQQHALIHAPAAHPPLSLPGRSGPAGQAAPRSTAAYAYALIA